MIKEKVQEAINKQINRELYSSYLYLSMSAYFKSINLPGFANWMHVQAQEELVHAMKFYDYLLNRGGKVILTAIDAPQIEWESPIKVFENSYAHEQMVTDFINGLVKLSIDEQDFATNSVLQWFVNEQVEEEANASGILQNLKQAGNVQGALFLIDRELAQRVFTPPPATGANAPNV